MLQRLTPQRALHHIGRYVTINLKNRSDIILRLWADHCEYIVAQRFRRGQQMFSLYRKIWEDRALKELFHRLRRQIQRRAKGIMLSSVGLLSFDWESERISYDSIKKHFDELDFVWQLQKETILCSSCNKRTAINGKIDGVEYCSCSIKDSLNQRKHFQNCLKEKEHWQPYLEGKNMIVWRREERHGLYAYKVYASYPDITAEDFLFVQTDIEYRKIWDKTAVELKIVDTDPVDQRKSQIIYWELLWPKLFANRDYVFNRRYFVDRARKVITIVSKSIDHPCCPETPSRHRVREYWSYMVIRPTDNFRKPGLEYVLTYFDNPGVVLPPAITAWVAQKQMPDFLNKLYCATVEYSQQRKLCETKIFNDWSHLRDPGFEYPPDPEIKTKFCSSDNDDDTDDGGPKKCESRAKDDSQQSEKALQEHKTHWWSFFFAAAMSANTSTSNTTINNNKTNK